MDVIDFILHVDSHLADFLLEYGPWVYGIMFLIIFVETGIVVWPFLPGDSLLFAAGMLSAQFPETFHIGILLPVVFVAAILGDSCNYTIGRELGDRILKAKIFGRNFVKDEHIQKTHEFYTKHGSKTIVIARFVPIVRTLAPFVAGVGHMHYKTFISYNVIGAFIWTFGVTLAGYFLGNIPLIKDNFEKVIIAIVFVSILPMIFAYFKEKMRYEK